LAGSFVSKYHERGPLARSSCKAASFLANHGYEKCRWAGFIVGRDSYYMSSEARLFIAMIIIEKAQL
jgi:hypothetical protein